MATKSGVRLVKCPKCHKLLPEPNVPVFMCGGCRTILRGKIRNNIGECSTLNLKETDDYQSDSSEPYFSDASIFDQSQNPSSASYFGDNTSDCSRDIFTESPLIINSLENIFAPYRNATERIQNIEEETDEWLRCRHTILGGAPFVICDNCFQLLRVESAIPTFGQRFLFRCANCSLVHFLAFAKGPTASGLNNSATKVSLNKKNDTRDHEDEWLYSAPNKFRKQRGCSTSESGSCYPLRSGSFYPLRSQSPLEIEMLSGKTSTLFDGTTVYGREYDMNNIIEFILSDNYERNVTVICIVAGGGMGKTTIAQLVFSDKNICDAFENMIFLCMSKNYDETRTIKEIIETITHVPCEIKDLSMLKKIAKDELEDKKVFVIMDDADHIMSQRFWDEIVGLLNNGAKGSALMVTTKSTTLIDNIGADYCYHLSTLSGECCWNLFKSRAFYGFNENARPTLVNIGKKLVSSCRKNPLCIKMLADLLYQSVTAWWWSAISENRLCSMNETEAYLLSELMVCYNHLPEHLKQCFMYCSLFPKNYTFSKPHLVRLWLSEGFIEPLTGKELEKIGMEYFDDLVRRSFFEHLHTCESKDEKYVMHDIIHMLAGKLSSNKYFRSEGCLQKVPESTSFLSVDRNEFQTISLKSLTTETKALRTTIIVGGSRLLPERDDAFTPLVPIVGLDDLFTEYRGLITLDLSCTAIEDLPHSITFLTCLKYLGLNNTNLKRIPTCISKLIALQTLEAKNCYYLIELPETLKELETLRHLDVTNVWGFVAMPHGIGKLTNIVSLATFHVGSNPVHSKIEELDRLENLQGSLQISGIENITCYKDAKRANLQGKPNLETLSLQWGSTIYQEEEKEEEEEEKDEDIAEKILENLRPNDNLEELIIRNYGGSQFPIWFEDPAFSKLTSIVLDNCYRCIVFPVLGRLPSLRYLSINKMYGVCRIIDNASIGAANSSMYPSLELLNLSEMYGLEEWPQRNNQDFPQLRALSINKCPFIRRIPHFPTLLELSITYGHQFPEISDLPSLQSLKIEGFQKVESIYLSCHLRALKKLEIRHCKELSTVACSSPLASSTKLKIAGCQKLNVGNIHLTSPISRER